MKQKGDNNNNISWCAADLDPLSQLKYHIVYEKCNLTAYSSRMSFAKYLRVKSNLRGTSNSSSCNMRVFVAKEYVCKRSSQENG